MASATGTIDGHSAPHRSSSGSLQAQWKHAVSDAVRALGPAALRSPVSQWRPIRPSGQSHSYPFTSDTHREPGAHRTCLPSQWFSLCEHNGPYQLSGQMHENVGPVFRQAPPFWHECRWHSFRPHWLTLRPCSSSGSCSASFSYLDLICTSYRQPWKPECSGRSCGSVLKLYCSWPPTYRTRVTFMVARWPIAWPLILAAPFTDSQAWRPSRPTVMLIGWRIRPSRTSSARLVKMRRGPEPRFHVTMMKPARVWSGGNAVKAGDIWVEAHYPGRS